MNYPIVKVKTEDGMELHGLLMEAENSSHKSVVINIHGTAGSFYWSPYYGELSTGLNRINWSSLSTNNRGTHVYDIEAGTMPSGAALEKFENCLLDIDAWIEFVFEKGYQQIVLSGHSFGTEKVVYYLNHGKYWDKIIGVILMGFCDSIGTQRQYEKKISKQYLCEAEGLVNSGRGEHLLEDLAALAGEIPISAQTYLNFFGPESKIARVMPFRNGSDWEYFQNIHVPILGVIGDQDNNEYTIVPINQAIEILRKENKLAEVYQIKDCDHCFNSKESELTSIITDFIKRRIMAEGHVPQGDPEISIVHP